MNFPITRQAISLCLVVFLTRTALDLAAGLDPWQASGGGVELSLASAIMMMPGAALTDFLAFRYRRRHGKEE